MKKEFEIRKAKLKDIPELVVLRNEFELFYKKLDKSKFNPCHSRKKNLDNFLKKSFRKEINSKKTQILVAEVEGRIVGCTQSKFDKSEEDFKSKNFGKIISIYINKKYRGIGISSQFKKNIFDWFSQNKVTWISLDVHRKNHFAHDLYKRWGFGDFEIKMFKKLK